MLCNLIFKEFEELFITVVTADWFSDVWNTEEENIQHVYQICNDFRAGFDLPHTATLIPAVNNNTDDIQSGMVQ